MITEGQWKRWKENSTTDDRLSTYVLSDIRQMLGEIERLRAALGSAKIALLNRKSHTSERFAIAALADVDAVLAQDKGTVA